MKAIRIKLRQSQASYTKEETVNNRMTYPLPQFSTIIGAIHASCGYTEYHDMNISVQGKYGAMQKEVYTNHALLNSTQDDRSILIWLSNPNTFSTAHVSVAIALENGKKNSRKTNSTKEETTSFYNRRNIRELDEEKLEEYISLKNAPKDKSKSKKGMKNPLDNFRTLTKGPQTQEVLYDVELVIHIVSDDKTLSDILEHKNDFVCLGRSEDFIELIEMKIVELQNFVDDECKISDGYSMYINLDKVENENYILDYSSGARSAKGTVYYLSKDYTIKKGKREFNRIPCLYSSVVVIDKESKDVYYDYEGGYIVDLN